ncbi:MAG TPA: phosphoenolpyruvate--protein phosphotransferase [Caulobacteraceae bacterium]|jgi:phosphocarrier protein FPr/phosphocarrier protein|nr:phosphoenolpyruvate--protein phosphotransferase [Caulobacteraceae bacterium]
MSDALTLIAPLAGWAMPLAETPDPVFAEKMLGEGLAIDPVLGELHAPCDGEVIGLHACSHALTLRADNGAEVLLHVGLETVNCGGEGFQALTAIGRRVAAGELLLRFDLDLLARRAASLVSPIVVINSRGFDVEPLVAGREVALGEPVLRLRPVGAETAAPASATSAALRRRVRVNLAHGLHARPAALVAKEAANFAAEVALEIAGRRANARSPVAVMALGVRFGDEIDIVASGDDAEAALEALAARVAEGEGEAGVVMVAASVEPPALAPASPLSALGGVPAAPGLAIGAAVRLVEPEVAVAETAGAPDAEHAALAAALDAVKTALSQRLAAETDQRREIVEAHLAFLGDPELRQTAGGAIGAGKSASAAWAFAIGGYVDQLRAAGDARMMERAADLTDLKRQVLLQLSGEAAPTLSLPDNAIILADDLLPSQLLELDAARVAGLAISRGGPTSHVAILAASMNIPAVVALGPRVLSVENGALLILDGDEGRLLVAPKPAEIAAAQTRLAERRSRRAKARASAAEPCRTADGARIEVFANLASIEEAKTAVDNGAEGCGLLRTEFLFMERDTPPSEDEQAAAYQAIAEALDGRPLIIRTLDIGADKPAPYLALPREENPALGVRGVRVSLAFPELLRTQLRAILRVRPAGQVQVMLPMVAALAEIRAVRAIFAELAAEIGVGLPKLGVMVETPAAAVIADLIAAEADFLSIGTNDLAQYALAMDRTSAQLAAQVDAMHPAVLRLVQQAAAGGARHGRVVSVCGGLASELAAAPILIGLGVTELSASPAIVPELKAAIRELTMAQCRDLAERALIQASAADARALGLSPAAPRLGAVS